MHGVTLDAISKLGSIEPWSAPAIEREISATRTQFEELPDPEGDWVGPLGDPWLFSWSNVDHLKMMSLAVLEEDARGDDLLGEAEVRATILTAADSEHEVVSRVAIPLAERLGLR
jgi:hypothetical protein